ncbi:SigmaK-factor processing regulatory protein BofA [Caloramator mitchellensis]|uniref:SigmaK-factor processing regulatory protein BofA n=1 Tax=Caloramator mitchellensis TaxID=908809 RepID=A0A0R3JRT5_CALMK|nr:pro-sigmaK processing inhibitor BofA family protein [Caloramator mitchellensis]KRQ86211.1 SigmaK-factor processing regulatory protein BofA [Caloramator mitchellensis]
MVLDQNVVNYLLIVALLLLIVISMKMKNLIVIKVLIKTAIGGLIIFAINLVLAVFKFAIPLNIINSFFVGVLGIPGFGLILMIKYFIYP